MAKEKKEVYFCKECGYESAKWMGQCPACREWNTFIEEPVSPKKNTIKRTAGFDSKPAVLSNISVETEARTSTGISEFDRVLGGGIVAGSMILVGGDPGIGKSTLLLQVCRNLSSSGKKVLYVSGEESLKQIKIRADRIGSFNDNLLLLCETDLDMIKDNIDATKPDMVIIDSIQTIVCSEVESAAGSVSQVRESTNALMHIAKGMSITIFIVGHVTKEGVVAGPRVLEHMVDTVLYFEGDRQAAYRLLRSVKNRFGATNEIGVFEMKENGLEEVLNPSEYMLNGRADNASGSVITCLIEGTRPMLIEIQALVCKTNFGMPRRTAAGTDYNRVNLLMAVLEKRLGYHFSEYDAYLNITGGMKACEPALDLGIAMAIISSYRDRALPQDMIAFGEIGLSGEIRSVTNPLGRLQEAVKLGFTKCVMPESSIKGIKVPKGIEIKTVRNLREVADLI